MSPGRPIAAIALTALIALTGTLAVPPAAQAAPAAEGVLVSEIASGGSRGSGENFIEIGNFGDETVDISGWRVYRCGETGDRFGPQATVAEGTRLAPGQLYVAADSESGFTRDATYTVNLHTFTFGAWIEDAAGEIRDRVGFAHPGVDNACANPDAIETSASWAHNQSHQRVAATGDAAEDWVVADRTVGAANAKTGRDLLARDASTVRISEVAPGGPGGYSDDIIELHNFGQRPADISGYRVWRCGANAQTYPQSNGLPAGTVLDPGETFVLGGTRATKADLRYAVSLHWQNSGAMLLTPDQRIVDRMSMYYDRTSPCTDGDAAVMKLDVIAGESFQRVSDTRDNATDFVAAVRTPGSVVAQQQPAPARPDSAFAGGVVISEITAGAPVRSSTSSSRSPTSETPRSTPPGGASGAANGRRATRAVSTPPLWSPT